MRKGLGKGRGSGYYNILKAHDHKVHYDAGHGRKQPQRMPIFNHGGKVDLVEFRQWQKKHSNFMTPDIIKLIQGEGNDVVEVSEGTGIDGEAIYGVSLITRKGDWQYETDKTGKSKMFHSKEKALEYAKIIAEGGSVIKGGKCGGKNLLQPEYTKEMENLINRMKNAKSAEEANKLRKQYFSLEKSLPFAQRTKFKLGFFEPKQPFVPSYLKNKVAAITKQAKEKKVFLEPDYNMDTGEFRGFVDEGSSLLTIPQTETLLKSGRKYMAHQFA